MSMSPRKDENNAEHPAEEAKSNPLVVGSLAGGAQVVKDFVAGIPDDSDDIYVVLRLSAGTDNGVANAVRQAAAPGDCEGSEGWSEAASDITEAKRAEEALRESEQKTQLRAAELQAVLESMSDGVYIGNMSGIVIANRAALDSLGFASPEELNRNIATLAKEINTRDAETGEVIPAEKQAFARALHGERVVQDVRIRHRVTGEDRVVRCAASPVVVNDRVIAAVAVNTDITERRRAVEALRESEQTMRITIEAAEMATWAFDLRTNTVRWNDRHYRIFGLEPGSGEESVDRFLEFVHPDDRKAVRKRMQRTIDEKIPYECEFRIVRTDGEVCWMSGYGRITREENGEATMMSGVMYDVTARKKAEAAMRASEERLSLLMDSLTDIALFTTDTNSIVTAWNPGAEKIFGFAAEEMVGKKSADIIFTPEDVAKGVPDNERRTSVRDGKALDERWHMRKNGERFFASGFMVPLTDGEKLIGYGKIASDLPERKKYEDQLKQAHEELEKRVAERTKELAETNSSLRQQIFDRKRIEDERVELLRKIVTTQEDERRRIARDLHDQMGQRLTALRLQMASLKERCADNNELCEQIEQLQKLGESVDSEASFLAWELRPTVLDDLGLVTAVDNFVREWSQHFGIHAEFHSSGLNRKRLSSEIETNLYRITQEALNNVYKHAQATAANVLLELRKKEIVLIVEDNGVGFDVEKQRIDRRHGSAMGLLGIQERAAIVGGTVEIESGPDKGTTVFARIPAVFAKDGD